MRSATKAFWWATIVLLVAGFAVVPNERLLSIDAACKKLSIGRTSLFELIRLGQIPSCRVGRRRLLPSSGIDAFIAAQLAKQTS